MSTSGIESSSLTNQLQSAYNPADLIPSVDETSSQELFADDSGQLSINMDEVYKSLTILAKEVLDKLQGIIGDQLPEGVYALKPEDHTPEKSAQRIVDGTTALMGVFSKQHPELEGEELITEFMSTIRSGIQTGYGQAEQILGDIGAFQFEGVQSGIDETKKLVEEKLKAFEDNYRKKNGLITDKSSEEVQILS